jgi:hypothetical protein
LRGQTKSKNIPWSEEPQKKNVCHIITSMFSVWYKKNWKKAACTTSIPPVTCPRRAHPSNLHILYVPTMRSELSLDDSKPKIIYEHRKKVRIHIYILFDQKLFNSLCFSNFQILLMAYTTETKAKKNISRRIEKKIKLNYVIRRKQSYLCRFLSSSFIQSQRVLTDALIYKAFFYWGKTWTVSFTTCLPLHWLTA